MKKGKALNGNIVIKRNHVPTYTKNYKAYLFSEILNTKYHGTFSVHLVGKVMQIDHDFVIQNDLVKVDMLVCLS